MFFPRGVYLHNYNTFSFNLLQKNNSEHHFLWLPYDSCGRCFFGAPTFTRIWYHKALFQRPGKAHTLFPLLFETSLLTRLFMLIFMKAPKFSYWEPMSEQCANMCLWASNQSELWPTSPSPNTFCRGEMEIRHIPSFKPQGKKSCQDGWPLPQSPGMCHIAMTRAVQRE